MNLKPSLTSLDDPKYVQFKEYVSSFKQTRYYIIDFASVEDLRANSMSTDAIANIASEYFDDHEWPIRKDPDITAPGYWDAIDEQSAEERMVDELCGGPGFGHTNNAMSTDNARKILADFMNFFDKERTLYAVNLGDPAYTFRFGILAIDQSKAGVLNVVQGD